MVCLPLFWPYLKFSINIRSLSEVSDAEKRIVFPSGDTANPPHAPDAVILVSSRVERDEKS
jgi:hypothetical protein